MNSYRENLQDSVGASLNALYAQKQKLDSKSLSDQYNLYHAQGAQLTANEALESVQAKAETIWEINQKGVEGESILTNLLSSATLIQTNTATLTGNSATAAANIQIAANAIAKIAADIGSALNVASTYCYQTDIYKKTVEANSYIRETANLAEYASKQAMEASYASAEVIAKELLDSANASKAELETLTTATRGQQTTLVAQITADQKALETASQTERKAEGALRDTERETDAIDQAVTKTNTLLNYSLAVTVDGANSFEISFQDYQQPFSSPDKKSEAFVGPTDIPSASPTYHVFVCKADRAATVKLEMVESLSSADSKALVEVPTNSDENDTLRIVRVTLDPDAKEKDMPIDIDGDPITQGVSYVAFMYGEPNQKYQKYLNCYTNLLSCASDSFNLLLPLPKATSIELDHTLRGGNEVQFTLDGTAGLDKSEFRLMMLPATKTNNGKHLLSLLVSGNKAKGSVNFYFNEAIAAQVSPANYISLSNDSEPDQISEDNVNQSITVPLDVTDNFGAPLIEGDHYVPVIFTVCAENSTQYASNLTMGRIFKWHGESFLHQSEDSVAKTNSRSKKKAAAADENKPEDDDQA